MTRQADAGFTLIEALVAMAVLALGAVSLLSASEGHTRRITDLSDRVAARWAAEYRLSELRAGLPAETSALEIYGIDFDVTVIRRSTEDPAVEAVTLRSAIAGTDQPLYVLDGYLDIGAPS